MRAEGGGGIAGQRFDAGADVRHLPWINALAAVCGARQVIQQMIERQRGGIAGWNIG